MTVQVSFRRYNPEVESGVEYKIVHLDVPQLNEEDGWQQVYLTDEFMSSIRNKLPEKFQLPEDKFYTSKLVRKDDIIWFASRRKNQEISKDCVLLSNTDAAQWWRDFPYIVGSPHQKGFRIGDRRYTVWSDKMDELFRQQQELAMKLK